ncbi:ABC transporter permease [Acidisoma cellulosilytica]|uniref:Autoinducer 2 import system permease protein LsrC n=1 Tax=Acidisoma cellulosilyticum TaxID=2802395 RepID=A0A964E706_9PROT|nr:ABC transporter permease [Acidisoma cellulosilyticum]MCB8883533.1 ABC transporter permease [Acidisoma cellulosilyticum]
MKNPHHRSLLLLATLWLVMLLIFVLIRPAILQLSMAESVLHFSSMLALVGLGQALLILSGAGMDISVGGMVSLTAILTMMAVQAGVPAALIPLLALVIGLCLGLVNGVLVISCRLLSLIATLGTMFAYGGLALALTGGATVSGVPGWLLPWGRGTLLGIPAHFLTTVMPAYLIAAAVLALTPLGRWILAMGNNERSARLVGIPVGRIRFILYGVSGLLSGLAALISLAWFGSGRPDIGTNMELESLAAVLLGGVAIAGGRGGVGGVLAAVLLVVGLQAGLQYLNISSSWQLGVVGLLLILALLSDRLPWRFAKRV